MKRTMLFLSISVLAVVILASIQLAEAQQAGKVYRIGYLNFKAGPGKSDEAFREGLRDLGWIEGIISSSSIAGQQESGTAIPSW